MAKNIEFETDPQKYWDSIERRAKVLGKDSSRFRHLQCGCWNLMVSCETHEANRKYNKEHPAEFLEKLLSTLEEEDAAELRELWDLRTKCEQQAKEIEELKRIKDDFFAENTRYARGWKKADDKIAKQAAVLREARALLSVLLILLDLEHVAAPENTNDLLARIDSVLQREDK